MKNSSIEKITFLPYNFVNLNILQENYINLKEVVFNDSPLKFDQRKNKQFNNLINLTMQYEKYDEKLIRDAVIYMTENENLENLNLFLMRVENLFIKLLSKNISKMKKLKTLFLSFNTDIREISKETLTELHYSLNQCTILEKVDVIFIIPIGVDSDNYQKIKKLKEYKESLFNTKVYTLEHFFQFTLK